MPGKRKGKATRLAKICPPGQVSDRLGQVRTAPNRDNHVKLFRSGSEMTSRHECIHRRSESFMSFWLLFESRSVFSLKIKVLNYSKVFFRLLHEKPCRITRSLPQKVISGPET